jgi:hypothetical protein
MSDVFELFGIAILLLVLTALIWFALYEIWIGK